MYYYIKGKLAHKDIDFVVIDAGGVGYKINTSQTSMQMFGDKGADALAYTYLHVREDVMDLYGFAAKEEREMFLRLLSISGVGPKAALAILSVATPSKLAVAVLTNDTKIITKAAGVGPKLAQRVILELKDKLKDADLHIDEADAAEAEAAQSDSKSDAVSALVVLGYSANEARDAVRGIDGSLETEEIIKKALINLM